MHMETKTFPLSEKEFLAQLDTIVQRALAEDIGPGDVTTEAILSEEAFYHGIFLSRESGIFAGRTVAERTFAQLSDAVTFRWQVQEGDPVQQGTVLGTLEGPGRILLSGERVALNFMQRMSGIATLTHKFVQAVQGTKARILDTRKTAPGLRLLDKWAVRLGGGQNHRMGLYDMVLIKENHIMAAGSIAEAVRRVRAQNRAGLPIEVEVKNLTELREALDANVDRILLDNMSIEEMRRAVEIAAGRIPLEASGTITFETIAEVAHTGVDYISVGMLTHSVRAMDISFLLKPIN